jgi:hypothetical protein
MAGGGRTSWILTCFFYCNTGLHNCNTGLHNNDVHNTDVHKNHEQWGQLICFLLLKGNWGEPEGTDLRPRKYCRASPLRQVKTQ